jgi:aldehyde:ferredoxin oxidoreductase
VSVVIEAAAVKKAIRHAREASGEAKIPAKTATAAAKKIAVKKPVAARKKGRREEGPGPRRRAAKEVADSCALARP